MAKKQRIQQRERKMQRWADNLRKTLKSPADNDRLLWNCSLMSDQDIKSDCGLAAQMLALDVCDSAKTTELYRLMIDGALDLAREKRYPAAQNIIRVLQHAAKLALDAEMAQIKLSGPQVANLPAREGEATTAFIESATPAQLQDTAKVLAELGILDRLAGRVEKQVDQSQSRLTTDSE